METKFDEISSTSSDKQGTYYQFLIERKVPKGTLRHIASLLNVTYEFVPAGFKYKRRKIDEAHEDSSNSTSSKKENSNIHSNLARITLDRELHALKNLELKRQEDKSIKVRFLPMPNRVKFIHPVDLKLILLLE